MSELSALVIRPTAGAQFICEVCNMKIEVLTDCGCTVGPPKFWCCGQPLTFNGYNLATETKQALVERLQKGIEASREGVEWIRRQSQDASDSAKRQFDQEARKLADQTEKLRKQLDEVRQSTGDAWQSSMTLQA